MWTYPEWVIDFHLKELKEKGKTRFKSSSLVKQWALALLYKYLGLESRKKKSEQLFLDADDSQSGILSTDCLEGKLLLASKMSLNVCGEETTHTLLN